MGPGIFTRYSKQVLGGSAALLLLIAALGLYYQFRSPVGGASPYETVNDIYEWEYMTFAAEQEVYPAETETICLRFRNDAPDGVVALAAYRVHMGAYALEILQDGQWHSVRAQTEKPSWGTEPSGILKTDIVQWGGGELVLYCPVAKDYPAPLAAGHYRIVVPNCDHLNSVKHLAAEFCVE